MLYKWHGKRSGNLYVSCIESSFIFILTEWFPYMLIVRSKLRF